MLRLIGDAIDPIAPALWAHEIRNSILTGLRRKRITRELSFKLLTFLKDLDVKLLEPIFPDRIFELADSNNLTVYDAAYLELALREDAPLASLDNALRVAAMRNRVTLFQIPTTT